MIDRNYTYVMTNSQSSLNAFVHMLYATQISANSPNAEDRLQFNAF